MRVCLGPSEVKTLSTTSNRAPHSGCAPQTVLERRVASVCSRLPKVRPAHEVRWLASHLRKIPTLQHLPAWKLESLGRNMTAAFAREGDDAWLLCVDPAFSYFLVSGSLVPIEATSTHAAPSLLAPSPLLHSNTSCSSRRAPSEECAVATEAKTGEPSTRTDSPKGGKAETSLRLVAYEIEKPPGLAFCPWTYPHDNSSISASAFAPVQGTGGENLDDASDLGSAVSKSLFSVPMTTPAKASTSPPAPDASAASSANVEDDMERPEGCPIFPGQSLDLYLQQKSVSATEETGTEGSHDEAGRPEVVSAFPEGSIGVTTAARRWRLEAQGRVCVGRVSRRFLQELEREEPMHDIEVKVDFLRRTEVFGDGHSLAALQRLAVLMERQEQPEATVVRRKGAAVDKVVMIESGEAIRLGDPQADSMKNHSSLRIRAGQMFGAEEALSGIPVFTGNLMTMSPTRFFTIPTAAFVRATHGVWTQPLYRLRTRARVMSHGCRAPSGGQQRPSTATGVGSERSASRNLSSGASGEKSLPALTASQTRPAPLTLAPLPLFSGGQVESDLEERINTLAAFWTPWSWSGDDGSRPSQEQGRRDQQEQARAERDRHKQSSPFSRPHSAPAPATRSAAPAPLHQVYLPRPRGGRDNDDGTNLHPFQKTAARSRSTGELSCKRNGDLAGAPGDASNLFAAARRRGGGERQGCVGEASLASPDFRRLGPSDYRSTPLAGCDFDALPAGYLEGSRPAAVAETSRAGSKFRPETLMARRGSSSGSKGRKQDIRHDRQVITKKRPATLRPTTAPATDRGRRVPLEDKSGVGWLNPPLGERPPVLGVRSGDDNALQVGTTGGMDDAGTEDSDSGSVLTWKGICRAPPSLSTQSSSSPGSASTSLAATLDLWTKRDIAAARRAVSCRPQRTRLCLTLRVHESTSAGMAAAQRSHRGAFVMSKMGDAKARSTWRP